MFICPVEGLAHDFAHQDGSIGVNIFLLSLLRLVPALTEQLIHQLGPSAIVLRWRLGCLTLM